MLIQNPIENLETFLVLDGRVPAAIATDMRSKLLGPLPWRLAKEDAENGGTFIWEARLPEWQFVVADFSIADQPGRKVGDRGQCLSATYTPKSHQGALVLFEDRFIYHQAAAWLLSKIQEYGAGKTRLTLERNAA